MTIVLLLRAAKRTALKDAGDSTGVESEHEGSEKEPQGE
jgi:hypothetical protein